MLPTILFSVALSLSFGKDLSPVVRTNAIDVLEWNHFYDCNGKLVFDQFIFWHWNPQTERFEILAWRLDKVTHSLDRRRGIMIWMDGERLRRVHFHSWRETWTQWDPELLERSADFKDTRKELGN